MSTQNKGNHPFTSVIIVAAGSGTRMGGVIKPLIKLHRGKTVFEFVIDAFKSCARADEIIVVCKDSEKFSSLVGETDIPVKFAPGGSTRALSVFNGVRAADEKCRFVCIHDCARPFIKPEDIMNVCDKAYETGAAAACSPVVDTIKYSDPDKGIHLTPARDRLIAVSTPQVFRKEVYFAAFSATNGGEGTTDDTTGCEKAGVPVSYVKIETDNMKLTTAYDVKKAKAICFLEETEKQKAKSRDDI